MSSEKSPSETAASEEAAAPGAILSPEEHVNMVGKVESKIPGRMRVRVKPELRSEASAARLQKSLDNHPDIRDAQVNPQTGSVTFTHKPGKDGHKILSEVLQEAELLADVAFEIPSEEEGEEGGGEDPYGKLDQQLADLTYKVEGYVYRKTGLRFRGQVIAGSVAGLGVAQMLIYGISFEMLPGPVLIWLGWDIYHRVNKEPPLPGEPGTDKAEGAEAGAAAEAEAGSGAEPGAGFTPPDGLPAAA
ncbi:MAG: hypothetical protein U0X20_04875 [Caldilineaceae bacterium]